MSPTQTQATELLGQITSLLTRGEIERYAFSDVALERVMRLVEEAAAEPDAVRSMGDLLKLVHVLRSKHESPRAAEALTSVLRCSSGAMRIIALHWSGRAAQPRLGADLMPLQRAQAPYVDDHAKTGGLKVSAFLISGRQHDGRRL